MFVLSVIVALIVRSILRRAKADKVLLGTQQKVETGAGKFGIDLKSIVAGVSPTTDPSFPASFFADQIKAAPGFFDDDEEAVYKSLGGKTKAQVAAIMNAYTQKYGGDLDTFLRTFLNDEEYQKALSGIR